MKTTTVIQAYKIVVSNRISNALVFCVIYKVDYANRFYGAHFSQLVTSFDNSTFIISDVGHAFTWQEELRLFAHADSVAPENLNDIEPFIRTKMEEAYGEGITIDIEKYSKEK